MVRHRQGHLPVSAPRWRAGLVALVAALVIASPARAQPDGDRARGKPGRGRLAVWKIEALGTKAEIVERLEALFRMELTLLSAQPLPSRLDVERATAQDERLSACTGAPACLREIGSRIGADQIVAGNVAQLGDSFVLHLKLVDVATGKEIRRVATEPLRGTPDDLIESIRVAAYRLVTPERLFGAIGVLTDLQGAEVAIDGRPVGTTPLAGPIQRLPLGPHQLRVTRAGYSPFEEEVRVRFQKTTRVVVRLTADPGAGLAAGALSGPTTPARQRAPWYSSTWFYIGVGVAAVVLGAYAGYRLSEQPIDDCNLNPSLCQP